MDKNSDIIDMKQLALMFYWGISPRSSSKAFEYFS